MTCSICKKDGYEHMLIGEENKPFCKEHVEMIERRIGLEDCCVFCDGLPQKELKFANKRIGDYEAGERPNIIRLCNKHLEEISDT